MPIQPDTTYGRRAWNEPPPRWSYLGPFASVGERLTQQALSAAILTPDEIRQYTQQPLRQIQAFPPRFGYPDYNQRQAGIGDVADASRDMPNSANFSGGPAGYTGSSRYTSNALGFS